MKLYTQAEIQERFHAWAKLPSETMKQILKRQEAWYLYVDARDNLPYGTTKKSKFTVNHKPSTVELDDE